MYQVEPAVRQENTSGCGVHLIHMSIQAVEHMLAQKRLSKLKFTSYNCEEALVTLLRDLAEWNRHLQITSKIATSSANVQASRTSSTKLRTMPKASTSASTGSAYAKKQNTSPLPPSPKKDKKRKALLQIGQMGTVENRHLWVAKGSGAAFAQHLLPDLEKSRKNVKAMADTQMGPGHRKLPKTLRVTYTPAKSVTIGPSRKSSLGTEELQDYLQ
jgi:hypothetical protein